VLGCRFQQMVGYRYSHLYHLLGTSLGVGFADGLVLIIDPDNATIGRTHRSHKYGLSHFAFLDADPTGSSAVAVPSYAPGKDQSIRLWDLSNNRFWKVFHPVINEPIRSISTHSCNKTFLSTSASGTTYLWDSREDKPVWTSYVSDPNSVSTFSKQTNSQFFAMSHPSRKAVTVRDMRAIDTPVHEFSRLSCNVDELLFYPDGSKLLLGSHHMGTVTTLDIAKHKELSMIFVPPMKKTSTSKFNLSISPDGRYCSISTATSSVEIWDLHARVKVTSLPGHGGNPASAFSPIHTLVATASIPVALWVPSQRNILDDI